MKTITVTKETKLPGTGIILEAGDKIKILKEYDSTDSLAYDLLQIVKEYASYNNDASKAEIKKDLEIAVKKVIRML